jgi:septum formation protein
LNHILYFQRQSNKGKNLFILKSRSPRRIEILQNLGIKFEIEPSDIDEEQMIGEHPLLYLKRMVTEKIGRVDSLSKENLYLSCDTIVVRKDSILHKPKDKAEAFEILNVLNGKSHSVYSGCMIYFRGEWDFFFEESKIQFKNWKSPEIYHYIDTCNPLDKAGSYGIQDENSPVSEWTGSYNNVMGFPIRGFYARWQKWISAWN